MTRNRELDFFAQTTFLAHFCFIYADMLNFFKFPIKLLLNPAEVVFDFFLIKCIEKKIGFFVDFVLLSVG